MRRRYVYDEKLGEMVEVTPGQAPPRAADGALWGDRHYDGLRATDGTDISTRKKHREYMKRNNLTTADDFTATWARAKREREHYMQHGGSVRRQDIEAAMYRVLKR